jgi:hypothetical protein
MIDLSAPILPGIGAGGIALGANADDIVRDTPDTFRLSFLGSPNIPGKFVVRYRSAPLELWATDAIITRIILREGYTGRIDDAIGIGSTIADLEELDVPWEISEDGTIVLPDLPGVMFTIDNPGMLLDEAEARIISIVIASARAWP